MQIDVQFIDRVGMAMDIMAVFANHGLYVRVVEIDPRHIFVDAPAIGEETWPELRQWLHAVDGVTEISTVDMLPGERRRLHLDAVLASMPDPVLALDSKATIVMANAATAAAAGVSEAALPGVQLGELFGNPALQEELISCGFQVPLREVMLHNTPFLFDAKPLSNEADAAGKQVNGGLVILHAPTRMGERLAVLQGADATGFENMIGASSAIRELKERAARVAAVDAPLLVLGETGTGKELVARACHQASSRRDAPFLALNCAALPENLAESELFGYAPGAFSGAQRAGKPGLLELANPGTVFLDEVAELSPYIQAKLLRCLQDGTFRRVGGEREVKVNVRIISATHRNLDQMVREGTFREDLYYRLHVLNLKVPPLRDRGDDVLTLARHFIERACAQAQRTVSRLTPAANAALLSNPWPGNVRQLENVIFRAVTMNDKTFLDVEDLELAKARVANQDSATGGDISSWDDAVTEFETGLLRRLYPLFPSSRKLAAYLKTSHTMIANKLRKYGIPG